MEAFVPLSTSIFDPEFTLDPFPWLEDLYRRRDVVGFSSEGMNFCFRYADCRDLISAHRHVSREPPDTDDSALAHFAEEYPARAWGFDFDDEIIANHHRYSMDLVKSFDNYNAPEALLIAGDAGMGENIRYCREQLQAARPGTLLHDFARDIHGSGIEEDYGVGCLVSMLQSTPNTLSVSTTLMLRNILRFPQAVQQLRDDPQRVSHDVITEFLRRDNHVKSLARQVHEEFELHGHRLCRGDSLYIFYPGVNLDPTHWDKPLALDFARRFTHDNHNIFGGSRYACIGSRIALKYFSELLPLLLQHLPASAELVDEDLRVEGDWITERVISQMPIRVH